MKLMHLLALLSAPWSPSAETYLRPVATHGRCEIITIPQCRNLPYNRTIVPNLMGNQNQKEAEGDIHPYYPLIKIGCSPDIRLFLCALYAPVCTILEEPLPPCRELCLSARSGCESLMEKFDFSWPKRFDCQQFPPFEGARSQSLCVGQANNAKFSDSQLEMYHKTTTDAAGVARPDDFDQMMDFVCPAALNVPKEYEYRLKIGDTEVENCGAPCFKLFFDRESIDQMRAWVGIWSVMCLASTLFTLSTFFIDPGRFPYPEKPIIYLSTCYLVVSIVYLVGFAARDSVACNDPFPPESHGLETERVVKQGTLHDWRCSILGMLLYFFVMAGAIWWVVLTFAWFLSAGLKWGQESIDFIASYFHAFVWTLASMQTILVLVLKKIEGDVLSGVCFVGLLDDNSLLFLVVVPLATYLFVGLTFLVLGFGSLLRIRTVMKMDGTKTDKLERLIMRIGTFSSLYFFPAASVVGCYIYEYVHLSDWMTLWQEDICRHEELSLKWQVPCRYPDGKLPQVEPPNFHVFMLKYVMIFTIGIFSGFWVWSGKTVVTWKSFYSRLCGGYRHEANV